MSRGKLPEGWVETQLGNIIELKYGKSLAARTRDGFGFPVYGSNGVVGKHSIPLINKSGLIVGRKGSYGVVNKSVGPFFPIDTTYYIDDFYNQPLEFLFYYLSFLPLTKLNRSTAIPGLNRDDAYDLNIALPPLAEQKIIAEKLDTLLAQVDSTKARLEQIPQILKRFRQAVLAVAVNGKLADKQDGNNHWQEQQLSHVASHIVDCPHSTPKWSSEGKYCVRTTAFSPFYLDLSNQGYVDEETYQNRIQRLKPEPDDILYSREGTIGVACQIPKGVELCLGQRMVLIRASAKISSKYLAIVLNSNHILKIVRSKTMGSTAPRINMSDIKSYPIPLPPLQEQHEIVRRVEQLFACADTIEKQVNNALTRVNSLTQSILAKAFRGELTAQWRAENPDLISGENSAAALLEKIKAERAASGGKKTSRKKA
ncbi:restriction endonuclease subunit S [Salmonella enterica]|nr:restriction endonuclease subunit S [Salmonella enterica]ECC3196427.1 restriction endonuclease subunit S [Salmonella enterica subsp. enterica]EDA3561709.1 restriction endonuclease subunit S [Salmonella enterica subsp. enterica serovar Isangi]HCM6279388.1 restriction endonuclease subunit S [Salmonella enterica subsp. enterica serovar -:d:1,5]EBJ5854709.1 restriction endonuclease subunit S [Salmonella enterica]